MPFRADEHHAHRETGRRVFVLEDVDAQRNALARQLETLGFECRCASTCAEARELISDGPFAIGLIDIGLPDGRGLDLLEELHRVDALMVPVMLTGEQDVETIIEAMRGGAFDYLVKPVSMMTLTGGVRRAIAHHELLRERAALVNLLREERDQLKVRIDEATSDIRAYATSCERSNALLHSLLRLSQLSEGFHSDEELLREVFGAVSEHLPLRCAIMFDVHHREFLAALDGPGGTEVVVANAGSHENGLESAMAVTEPDLLTRYWVQRHTGLDTSRVQPVIFPQAFWGRQACVSGFYLDMNHRLDAQEREFLGMCGHFLAYEWQRSRMMLHAAQHASLGNIALELSRSFLQSLSAIRAATDVISETAMTPDGVEGLNIIEHNVEFLTNQAQGFQELSQVREDSIETAPVSGYIEQTLDVLAMAIQNRGVKVRKELEPNTSCVLLNGAALARTLLDLLSNAVRTVGPGGELYIGLRARDEHRVECVIGHAIQTHELYGIATEGRTQSPVELVKGHPSFLLAQRTVLSCGGKLSVERNEDNLNTFRVLLPTNALNTPLVEEPVR